MSLDPYSLCPCESGKKLKFCCADIATEMLKALQLHEGGQSRVARKILEKLHQQQPSRAWISTSLAGVQLSMEEPVAAREALRGLLEENPNHPLGRILDATAALDVEGYDAARPAIHRAFTKGVKHHPEMVGSLAAGVATILLEEGRFLASRQHMALALRFARSEDREQFVIRLIEFDGDKSIPYLLRGVHNLKPLDGLLNEQQASVFKKSLGLSSLGCWREAAAVLTSLTDEYPDSADLWNNIALYHAWDGDESAAAAAFHQAGRLAENREQAIACETLGQLLDHELNLVTKRVAYFKCKSISRLFSKLDDIPRLIRKQDELSMMQGEKEGITRYQVLDREPQEQKYTSPINFEEIPKIIGTLTCIEAGDSEGVCRLTVEQEHHESVQNYLAEQAGDLIKPATYETEQGEEAPIKVDSFESGWLEYRKLDEVFYFGREHYDLKLSELEHEKWDYFSNQLWQNTPFSALNGKTPLEAVGDDDLAIPLAAAINIFDIFADQFNHQLEVDRIREQLKVDKSEPYEIENDDQLNSCEVLEMLRIPIEKLSNDQLKQLLARTQLIQHSRFSDRILDVVLHRDGIIEQERMAPVLHTFIDLAKNDFKYDVAFARIQLGREWSEKNRQKPTDALQWEIRELQLRMQDPEDHNDPRLMELLERLYQQYLRKMPELESIITDLLAVYDIQPPWYGGKILTSTGESVSNELWSPEKEAEANSGGKLWLPGQD